VDRLHFFRVGQFRLRRLESYLILYLHRKKKESGTEAGNQQKGADTDAREQEAETDAEAHERWMGAIRDHVNKNADAIHTYMKWRLVQYQARHPDEPMPQQVIFLERVHPMLPPEDTSGAVWSGPTILPLVRWRPGVEAPADQRTIERYNPVTEQFESVAK
jgi:hypothetical protein